MVLPDLWISSLPQIRPNTARAYLNDVRLLLVAANRQGIDLFAIARGQRRLLAREARDIAKEATSRNDKERARSSIERIAISINSFLGWLIDRHDPIANPRGKRTAAASRSLLSSAIRSQCNSSDDPGTSADLSAEALRSIRRHLPIPSDVTDKQSAIALRDRALFELTLATAGRRSEIVLLELGDVDLPEETVTFKQPSTTNLRARRDRAGLKTRGRCLPIPEWVADLQHRYLEEARPLLEVRRRPSRALFLSSRDGRRLSAGHLNTLLHRITARSQSTDRLHPHALRKAGLNIVKEGLVKNVSRSELQQHMCYFGGWSDRSEMPKHYTQRQIIDGLRRVANSAE